jgi:hypothetical protein
MPEKMSNEELETRKRNITTLVTVYYNNNAFLKRKLSELNLLIDKALDRYLYSDLSMEEIEKEIIEAINQLKNGLPADFKPKITDKEEEKIENKKNNNSKMKSLLNDLNEANVDYRVTGLAAISLTESIDSNSNVSFYINEKDFNKFSSVCKKNGFNFIDRRNNSIKQMKNGNVVGESNIVASSDSDASKIDAKGFERLSDNSIIVKDNFINSDGTNCIKADYFGKDLAKEVFDSDKKSVDDVTYPIVAPEFDYISRVNSSDDKDRNVAKKLESSVDGKRIDKIQNLAKSNYASQITKANNTEKKQNNDLSAMLNSNESKPISNTESISKEKPKQFVKTSTGNNQNSANNNGGYVSKLAFIFFLLLSVVLVLTGFLLLKM